MDDIPIIPLTRLDLRFEPGAWPFAVERRAEIDAHFVKLRARQAGNVERPRADDAARRYRRTACSAAPISKPISRASSRGATGAFPTPRCATASRWRRCARPTARFCSAQMGPHTATAGQIYFAAGTPDPNDIVGDTVDLERGVMPRTDRGDRARRSRTSTPQPGWTATPFGQRIALMKIVQARENAAALRERIRAYLARAADAGACRTSISSARLDDLDPRMPPYVRAYLAAALANRAPRGVNWRHEAHQDHQALPHRQTGQVPPRRCRSGRHLRPRHREGRGQGDARRRRASGSRRCRRSSTRRTAGRCSRCSRRWTRPARTARSST